MQFFCNHAKLVMREKNDKHANLGKENSVFYWVPCGEAILKTENCPDFLLWVYCMVCPVNTDPDTIVTLKGPDRYSMGTPYFLSWITFLQNESHLYSRFLNNKRLYLNIHFAKVLNWLGDLQVSHGRETTTMWSVQQTFGNLAQNGTTHMWPVQQKLEISTGIESSHEDSYRRKAIQMRHLLKWFRHKIESSNPPMLQQTITGKRRFAWKWLFKAAKYNRHEEQRRIQAIQLQCL